MSTARECWERINALIVPGELPGNGTDRAAQRNGVVLAANEIYPLAFPEVPASPWLDIAGAPRDGTLVDLWATNAKLGVAGRLPNCVWLDPPEDDWNCIWASGLTDFLVRTRGWIPTHYMAIPPGPT